jgi:hypothetical protein
MNAFRTALGVANQAFDKAMGEDIQINGVSARGIVETSPEVFLGSVNLMNAARLSLLDSLYPSIEVNSLIVHNGVSYLVIEPGMGPDAGGWRHYVLARH